jgi:nucleotide-binding universal stress UspA family protein
MSANGEKILLMVDGSEQALEVVNYAGKLFAPLRTEIVLFQVLDRIPETLWDWEHTPLIPQHAEYMKRWEEQKEQKARGFMERSRQTLIESGFPADSLTIKLQKRRHGIARDIISECDAGYTALMMGRKGASNIDDQMLGTTASKVIGKIAHLPVCLVGGKPKVGKILVGLDHSDGSMRASEFAARLARGHVESICLLHVVRAPIQNLESAVTAREIQEFMDAAGASMKPVFESARTVFARGGIDGSKVTTKVVTGVSSRANAVMKEAREARIGTMVVGRRGMSELEAFEMGRVSNKLIQFARDAALWIVG